MTPQFQISIKHPALGLNWVVIQEALGWESFEMELDRHPIGQSLVESFNGELEFYGSALSKLRAIEYAFGPDATVQIKIEVRYSESDDWVRLPGADLIDLSTVSERYVTDTNTGATVLAGKYTILREDFWSRFVAHMETEVDVNSANDIYGVAVGAGNIKTTELPSQKIQKIFSARPDKDIQYTIGGGGHASIDWTTIILSEIETKNTIQPIEDTGTVVTRPLFSLKHGGSYAVGGLIYISSAITAGNKVANVQVYTQVNEDTPIAWTKTDIGIDGVDGRTQFLFNQTLNLNDGDQLRFYFKGSGGGATYYWIDSYDSPFVIIAGTTFRDSETDSVLIHDTFKQIVDRIAGENRFRSKFFGHTSETSVIYNEIGCGFPYTIKNGYHLRGYTFSEKQLFQSFKKLFEGAAAIFNLGFGHATVFGQEVIEVEALEDFFNDADPDLSFTSITKTRSADQDSFIKSVTVGYTKFEPESTGGVTVPHGQITHVSKFKKIGNELQILSDLIAGDLVIEETRRQSLEREKDWKYDNDTFIIAVNPTPVDTDTFTPELDENFTSITNVTNSDTRYNIRLWPIWNLLRHLNRIVGGLQNSTSSLLRFVSGKGNYIAGAIMDNGADCVASSALDFAQNDNVPVNQATGRGDFLHSYELYDATFAMTFDEFRSINRKKGIFLDGNLHFIKYLSFSFEKGQATAKLWSKPAISPVPPPGDEFWLFESGQVVAFESDAEAELESA